MFATRNHDENAIHQQQTAAASKPLNQGIKGLAPKTPGNRAPKTPFKAAKNDENAAFGKTGGKGKDGGLFGDIKTVKADKSTTFVTPAGPRTRAPLGAKTTNAKANLLQTPALPSATKGSATKPASPRLRRAKVKIHTATSDPLDDDGVPDIEYMPPREVPLADYPEEDWPLDRTFPQFDGNNLTKGVWEEFGPKDKGSDDELSDFEEKCAKAEAGKKKREEQERRPGTVKSKSAASALAKVDGQARQKVVPNFAAPTAAARARMPSMLAGKKTGATSTSGNTRHTVAKAVSNTTLGYSKGRAVSATARAPLSSIHEKPIASGVTKQSSIDKTHMAGGMTFTELLGLREAEEEGEEDQEPLPRIGVDDELADFQLQL
ncbi:hypothetical protein LTR78_002364 [Recurvomyces mirabilis]|uniref:Uncharacterized protein n=1 Tax=Recurvomyces mirabilis TaxID=574656 RepID=A0AAE0WTE3_9PEZI|nr:hypothetical protein LTR78_002364 [Recurvomyces mirabilis]KAK5157293.1 hypothetical protein LTS14_004058 [Recurvomyces mirabilis]